jgi:hypothetical protein
MRGFNGDDQSQVSDLDMRKTTPFESKNYGQGPCAGRLETLALGNIIEASNQVFGAKRKLNDSGISEGVNKLESGESSPPESGGVAVP